LDEIKYGVPQESVLGPLLCLIYINDLANSIAFSEPDIFADDVALLSDHSLKSIKKTNKYQPKIIGTLVKCK